MKILVNKSTSAVVAITQEASRVTGGIQVGDTIFPDALGIDVYEVEQVPEGVLPQTHSYSPEAGFYPTPVVEKINPTEEILTLREQVRILSDTIDFILGV